MIGAAKLEQFLEDINALRRIEEVFVQTFGPGSHGHIKIWFKPYPGKSRYVVILGVRAERLKSGNFRITPQAVGTVHINDTPLSCMAKMLLVCDSFRPFTVSEEDMDRITTHMGVKYNLDKGGYK